MLMDWQLMAMFGVVLFITLLPLVVVLSSAPPLIDDAATSHRGWRIIITVVRCGGLESEHIA